MNIFLYQFLKPQFHRVLSRGLGDIYTLSELHYIQKRNPELREFEAFIVEVSRICPLLQREYCLSLPR